MQRLGVVWAEPDPTITNVEPASNRTCARAITAGFTTESREYTNGARAVPAVGSGSAQTKGGEWLTLDVHEQWALKFALGLGCDQAVELYCPPHYHSRESSSGHHVGGGKTAYREVV